MDRFAGKIAVVTGASAGIGAAIAEKLVEGGMKVVGVARRVDRIQQLSEKLKGKAGKLYAVQADLSKEEDIKNVLKWTVDNLGPIHVLVNNAGIVKMASFLQATTENIKLTFDTNVVALTLLSRDVINNMVTNKIDGHIININSVAGHNVLNFPETNVYAGSKFAVTALTETLRQELSRNGSKIRVTSLSPGYVDTEILGELTEEKKKVMDSMPSLQSEDVANAVAFILSCPAHVNISELKIQPVGENF